jgi:endonuclease YncB( thermonuclease family)
MTLNALARFLSILVASSMIVGAAAAEELATLTLCKLIPTEWADGDSFLIQTADGTSHTIRLYGADCIEWHVSDETDARRLRAQRRYFGISEVGGSPQGDR